jgi:glycosyltransferase involved in cell wall biosynthesis
MRILHLLGDRKLPRRPDEEDSSGAVRAVLELARAQAGLGRDTSIAAVGEQAWRAEWNGVHLIGLARARWARARIQGRMLDFSGHLPFVLLTRRTTFDIVHGHLYSYLRLLRAGRRVVHFHSDPFYRGGKNEGIDLKPADFAVIRRHSDAQVAVSQFIAGELERGFGGLGNVHLVYNGVDQTRFDPQRWREARLRLRQEWGVRHDQVVFLFVGAVVPEKGVIGLARAFAQIAADLPDAHLALAGASGLWGGSLATQGRHVDYEDAVRQALGAPLAAGQARFLGKVSASEMPAVYAAGDVVVIPSVCREAFPLTALEALASERPVIASAAGGLVEVVNKHNGILVPPGAEAALGAALCALAADPARREQLGRSARQQARQFSWETAARQLDAVYRPSAAKKVG